MHVLRQGSRFLFGVISPADVEETVSLGCRVLAQREPMAKALGLSAAELRPYVKACVAAACDEELGVIARDQRTRRVVGFSLAKDSLSSLQMQVPDKLLPMQEVFTTLQRWYLRDSSPRRFGVLGHELMTGVASEQLDLEARRATAPSMLGHELMALRTALLRARGFQRSFGVATGPRSQQLHAELGAFRAYSISYRDFLSTQEQRRPFSALSGQSCVLMLKEFQREAASVRGLQLSHGAPLARRVAVLPGTSVVLAQ
jgi:hypothetical protein